MTRQQVAAELAAHRREVSALASEVACTFRRVEDIIRQLDEVVSLASYRKAVEVLIEAV